MKGFHKIPKKPFTLGGILLILILLAILPLYAKPYSVISLTNILMYTILTVSWVIFSGPTITSHWPLLPSLESGSILQPYWVKRSHLLGL